MKRKQILFTLLVFVLSIFLLTGCKTKTKSTVTTKDNTSQTQPTQGSSSSQTTKGGSSSNTTGGGNQSSVTITPTQTTPKPVELKEGWEHDSEHHWKVSVDESDHTHYEEETHTFTERTVSDVESVTITYTCSVCGAVSTLTRQYKTPSELLAESNGTDAVVGVVLSKGNNEIVLRDVNGNGTISLFGIVNYEANKEDIQIGDTVYAYGKTVHEGNDTYFSSASLLSFTKTNYTYNIPTNVEVTGIPEVISNRTGNITFEVASKDATLKVGAVYVNANVVAKNNEGKYTVEVTGNIVITVDLIDVCSFIEYQETTLITTTKAGVNYYLEAKQYSSAPEAKSFTDVTSIPESARWNHLVEDGKHYFFIVVEGNTYYLYNSDTNNGVRTTTEKVDAAWTLEETSTGLSFESNGRFLGIYSAQDWRSYTTVDHNNYVGSAKAIELVKYNITTVVNRHELELHQAHAATCTTGGYKEFYECTVCHKYFSSNEGDGTGYIGATDADVVAWASEGGAGYIAPLGHDVHEEDITWSWYEKEDHTWGCKVTLHCSRDCGLLNVVDAECEVSVEHKSLPTCYAVGLDKYTATYTFADTHQNVNTTKDVELAKLAHNYGEVVAIQWDEDNNRWYSVQECENEGCTEEHEGHSKVTVVEPHYAIGTKQGFMDLQAAIDSNWIGAIRDLTDGRETDYMPEITLTRDITLENFSELIYVKSFGDFKITVTGDFEGADFAVSSSLSDEEINAKIIIGTGKELQITEVGTEYKQINVILCGIVTIIHKDGTHSNFNNVSLALEHYIDTDLELVFNDDYTFKDGEENVTWFTLNKPFVINLGGHTITCVEIQVDGDDDVYIYNGKVNGDIQAHTTVNGNVLPKEGYHFSVDKDGLIDIHEFVLVHVDQVEPTCQTVGTKEYWYCENCGKSVKYKDAQGNAYYATEDELVIAALEPDFDGVEPVYAWNDDETAIIATIYCKHEGCQHGEGHTITETAIVTRNVIQEQSCDLPELTELEAVFTNPLFSRQYAIVTTKNPAGHDYKLHLEQESTCSVRGNIQYYECDRCHNVQVYATVADFYGDSKKYNNYDGTVELLLSLGKNESISGTSTLIGTISKITYAYSEANDNITVYIIPIGFTVSSEIQCYKLHGGADLEVGDVIVVTGSLKKYGNTPEFDQANYTKAVIKDAQLDDYALPLAPHTLTKIDAKEATCEQPGHYAYYECSVCHKYFENAEGTIEIVNLEAWMSEGENGYVAPLGHVWEFVSLSFNDDNTAVANYKCIHDNAHTTSNNENVTVRIIEDVASTCKVKGHTTYEASITILGVTHKETKTVEKDLLTHTYKTEFTWLEDEASVTITCSVCHDEFVHDQDCVVVLDETQSDQTKTVYKASYTYNDIVYSESKTYYTVKFYDVDGSTTIQTIEWLEDGNQVVFKGTEPTKEIDEVNHKKYTFIGWATSKDSNTALDSIPAASANADYYPVFNEEDIKYNVTFTCITGMENIANTKAIYDETVNFTVTLKNGYRFNEFVVKANDVVLTPAEGTQDYTVQITGETSITFEGIELNGHNIYYYDEGGKPFSGVHGEGHPTAHVTGQVTTLVNPTKTGYDFVGWYEEENCVFRVTEITAATDRDVTLYAKWDLKSYQVTFVDDDGYQTHVIYSSFQYYGTKAEDIAKLVEGKEPTRESTAQYDYVFSGWTPEITDLGAANVTYTAIFTEKLRQYEVYFYDANGNELNESDIYDYGTLGSDIVTPAPQTKEATAEFTFTFLGWNTTADATVALDALPMVEDNLEFYPIFSATKRKYLVAFYAEDKTTVILAPKEYEYGTEESVITLPENPTKEATAKYTYTFAGWNDGTTTYAIGEIPDVTGDTNYYAAFSATGVIYTVTYDKNSNTATGSMANQSIQYGHTPYGVTPLGFTNEGYRFMGWSESPDGAVKYERNGEISNLEADVTLYAIWEKEYTLVFDVNNYPLDSTIKMANVELGTGSTAIIGEETSVVIYPKAPSTEGRIVKVESIKINNVAQDLANLAEVTISGNPALELEFTVTEDMVNGDSISIDVVLAEYEHQDGEVKSGKIEFGKNKNEINANTFKANDDLNNEWTVLTSSGTAYSNGSTTYSQIGTGTGSSAHVTESLSLSTTLSNKYLITSISAKFGGFSGTSATIIVYIDGVEVARGTLSSGDITVSTPNTFKGIIGKDITIEFSSNPGRVKVYEIEYSYDTTIESKVQYYTIVVNKPEHAAIQGIDFGSENSYTYVTDQAAQSFTVVPATGYTFTKVTYGTSEIVPESNTVSFTGLSAENDNVFTFELSPIKRYISFDKNGGEGETMADLEIVYDEPMKAIGESTYTRTGYVFLGWDENPNATTPEYVSTYKFGNLMRNITVYAIWRPITYTFNFNENGDDVTGSMESLVVTYDTDATLTANAFANDGYEFLGWSVGSASGLIDLTDGANVRNYTTTDEQVIDLYAVWVSVNSYHNVTLNLNEGVLAQGVELTQYREGVATPLPTSEEISREGFRFDGWYTEDGTNVAWGTPVTEIGVGETADLTFYAKWVQVFTVTFDTQGGSKVAAQVIDINGLVEKPADPTYTGHNFLGWFVSENEGIQWSFENNEITSDTVIYAKWTVKQHIISIESNNDDFGAVVASEGDSIIEANYGTVFTVEGNVLTINGVTYTATPSAATAQYTYAFASWSVENGDTLGDDEITITATFERTPMTYNVIFHANNENAEGTMNNFTVTYGEDAKTLTENGFTLSGHKFVKWNTQEDGKGTDYAAGATVANLEANLDLYAVWEELSGFNVSFNLNGSSGDAPTTQVISSGSKATKPADPTRNDYDFAGWYTKDSDGKYVAKWDFDTNTVDSDITLYAAWSKYATFSGGSSVTVEGKAGVKIAKGSSAKVNVESGAQIIILHIAAWNKEGSDLSCSNTDIGTITMVADSGISGSATSFTLSSSDKTQFEFIRSLNDINSNTQITFTTASNKRCVIWDVVVIY